MRALSSQKLIFLAIIMGTISVATAQFLGCGNFRRRPFGRRNPRLRPKPINPDPCFNDEHMCRVSAGVHDCLLPEFKCFDNGRCIPRSHYCNGILDCSDGSDERGCRTASSGSTTSSTMRSETVENTPSYIITTSTMLQGNEEKTTSMEPPESESNTALSSSTITSTMLPDSELNTVLSSLTTANTMLPDSESNTVLSSSATTSSMLPHSELNTVLSSSATANTMLPDSESNTVLSSSTTTNTRLPDSESNTVLSSSTRTSAMLPDSESNTVLSSSTTTKTMLPDTASKTSFPSFVAENKVHPDHEEKISSPITNTIFPDSSAMQSCPDGYCRQLEVCIVVQGQYHCKCPPSFIGVCEMQRGTHENVVTIVLFMTLAVLCLAIVLVGIYRYKRLSVWKSDYKTTRTLSQLTLTSNAVA